MSSNELDALLRRIREEAVSRGLLVFKASPLWDDDLLTTVEWRGDESDAGWREFLDVAGARKVPMLLEIAHSFDPSAFEPTPRDFRARLDREMQEEFEERDQMLAAASQWAGQTGRIEIGWIENGVFYQWRRETDWYPRVWELVSSGPFGFDDSEE